MTPQTQQPYLLILHCHVIPFHVIRMLCFLTHLYTDTCWEYSWNMCVGMQHSIYYIIISLWHHMQLATPSSLPLPLPLLPHIVCHGFLPNCVLRLVHCGGTEGEGGGHPLTCFSTWDCCRHGSGEHSWSLDRCECMYVCVNVCMCV